MSVHNVIFPANLSPGTKGGPGFQTLVRTSDSGVENRTGLWESNRSALKFDVSKEQQTGEEIGDLLSFYLCMRGGGHGFLFRDPTDWSTNPNGVQIPDLNDPLHRSPMRLVDESAKLWQLQKEYRVGSSISQRSSLRRITRPMKPADPDWFLAVYAAGLPIWVNGTQIFPAIEVSVSYDTGLVYLPTMTSAITLEAAFTFHVPVHFSEDTDDGFLPSWDEADGYSVALSLEELVGDSGAAHEEHLYGGGLDLTMNANPKSVHVDLGTYIRLVDGQSSGQAVRLHPVVNLPGGGPYFILENAGNGPVVVVDSLGTVVGSMTVGQTMELYRIDTGTAQDWEIR